MSNLPKVLIDTNVFIGLEDPKPVSPTAAELIRKCGEHGIALFVHEAAVFDIHQDTNLDRRQVSLSKLEKFRRLSRPSLPTKSELESVFGAIKKRNDEVDVELLHTLRINAVDFLITEDKGIHDRAKRVHCSTSLDRCGRTRVAAKNFRTSRSSPSLHRGASRPRDQSI